MGAEIITKFRVASDETVGQLLHLISTSAEERFSKILPQEAFTQYLSERYTPKALVDKINNFANQWLITYVDGVPAGYAFLTSRGPVQERYEGRKVVHLVDFEILHAYADTAAKQSLIEKCITTYKGYEVMWLVAQSNHPFISFFETQGFVKGREAADFNGLPVSAVHMAKEMRR